MNRYNYYNSDLDAFTNYHLQNEAVENTHFDGPSDQSNALIAGLSGAIGTSVATLAVYPIDLIVKRLQVQRQIRGTNSISSGNDDPVRIWQTGEQSGVVEKSKEIEARVQERAKKARADVQELYVDFADAAKRIYQEEGGIGAFYSGCLHDTANSMGTAFLYFLSYNYIRDRRLQSQANGGSTAKTLGMVEELTVGVLAGCFAKFFTSPIANVVTRKQTAALRAKSQPQDEPNMTDSSSPPVAKRTDVPSVRAIMKDIFKEKGIAGFWGGYKATLFLTLNPSITLFLYETFKTLLPRRFRDKPTAGQTFIIAAIAKALASSIMYPFSLAKARSQVEQGWKTGTIQMLRDIYREDGVAGLYEGVQGEVLKGFFQNGITMLIKEFIHRFILSAYFIFQRARERSPDQSITGTVSNVAQEVYEKSTTESQRAAVDNVTTASQNSIDAVKNTVSSTGTAVSNGAQTSYDAVKNTVSNTGSAVSNGAQTSYDAVKNTVSNTGTAVTNGASSGYEAAKSTLGATKDGVYNAADAAKEKLHNGYSAASGSIASTVDSMKVNASDAASKASDVASSGKSTIVDTAVQSRQGLAKMIDVDTGSSTNTKLNSTSDVPNSKIGGVEWDATDKLQKDNTSKLYSTSDVPNSKIGGVEWDATDSIQRENVDKKIGGKGW